MVFRLMRRAARWVVPTGAAILVLALAMPTAYGQYQYSPTMVAAAPAPLTPMPEVNTPQAPAAQPPAVEAPSQDSLAFGATGGGESFAAGAPNVIGDGGVSGTGQAAMRASAMKIGENESPRPGNRVYFNYNYFSDVQKTGVGVSRYMPGFEQTFLGGNASFGMRLPVFSNNNDGALGIQGFGNLNMIGKYAFINNRYTGNVWSGGMLLTAPTGRALNIGTAQIHDVVLQPFTGYIFGGTQSNFYLQGFSSVAVPTDARDITIMFNDVSTGYWLYRSNQDQFLSGVIPTIEGHVNTPLNHRGTNRADGFGLQDSFVLTLGSHFIIRQRAMLTLGVADPLTGVKPFGVEGIAQFNWRY